MGLRGPPNFPLFIFQVTADEDDVSIEDTDTW